MRNDHVRFRLNTGQCGSGRWVTVCGRGFGTWATVAGCRVRRRLQQTSCGLFFVSSIGSKIPYVLWDAHRTRFADMAESNSAAPSMERKAGRVTSIGRILLRRPKPQITVTRCGPDAFVSHGVLVNSAQMVFRFRLSQHPSRRKPTRSSATRNDSATRGGGAPGTNGAWFEREAPTVED